jgi:hypothetical protein
MSELERTRKKAILTTETSLEFSTKYQDYYYYFSYYYCITLKTEKKFLVVK